MTRRRTCTALTGCGPWVVDARRSAGTATLYANDATHKFDLVVDDDDNDPRCRVKVTKGTYELGSLGYRFEDVATPNYYSSTYGVLRWDTVGWLYGDKYVYGCAGSTMGDGYGYLATYRGKMTNHCFRATSSTTPPGGGPPERESVLSASF